MDKPLLDAFELWLKKTTCGHAIDDELRGQLLRVWVAGATAILSQVAGNVKVKLSSRTVSASVLLFECDQLFHGKGAA